MNPVVHFEMPASNRKRMSEFYKKAFGWKTKEYGQDMGNYVMAWTGKTKGDLPAERGMINGGFYQKDSKAACDCTSLVISVDDIKKHIETVKKAGGKIYEEPREIPEVGWFVEFKDTEGNTMSMLQPIMQSKR